MFRALVSLLALLTLSCPAEQLPLTVVFKGQERFSAIVARAKPEQNRLRVLPIGERAAWFGQALVGTPYKSYTLEIDDRIEAPSVNLTGLDCWTFFETALAFARLSELPAEQWTAPQLLRFIELDRYWGGQCTGSYLSRLHYLEDWAHDNDRRGYVDDLTRQLGAIQVSNAAIEMTNNWRNYRYMARSPANRSGIAKLEARLRDEPLPMIPKARVPSVEAKLQNGDIISIVSKDGSAYGTSHVGMALRKDGVLRFMHASSPRNYGKVVIDDRLSEYLARYRSHAGIMVARPVR